jgi:hypothetical protein
MKFLIPRFIAEWRDQIRQQGFRNFLRSKGWKIVLVFLVFYAIRDTILYVLIPYSILTSIPGC